MNDPLRAPGFLTKHQLPAVSAEGNIFLTACPGSGKTRAAAARLARLAEDGLRVAGCSYTNVGVEQLRHVLAHDLNRTLGPDHFIGTLHQFLLRFAIYPFGHLVTQSPQTPRLFADDAGWPDVVFENNRIRLPLSRFRFQPDGSLCVRAVPPKFKYTPEDAAERGQSQARRLKERSARQGRLSFDDAMYWALRVLHGYPDLAAAIAMRFDELLVDEAQDTSELQLACLDALCGTEKLRSLALVGDLEQSICSFTGASRAGCEQLASKRSLEVIHLSENWRCSQRICNVAVHFCSRDKPDHAVGEDADCPWQPELSLFPPEEPTHAVERFRARLEALGHDQQDAAVLARNNDLVNHLNGRTTPVEVAPRPLAIGRAVCALRGGGTIGKREIEAVERIIALSAWGSTDLPEVEPDRRRDLRTATMQLLTDAPDLSTNLRSWIRGIAPVLSDVTGGLASEPRHQAGRLLRSASGQEAHIAADVFQPQVRTLYAQTVHGVKGESRGAVLVVVAPRRSSKRATQGALWSRPLTGEPVSAEEAEELRIAFVALTRARRICTLALPENSEDAIIDAFQSAGFELRTT